MDKTEWIGLIENDLKDVERKDSDINPEAMTTNKYLRIINAWIYDAIEITGRV